jgi:hypothetical protein
MPDAELEKILDFNEADLAANRRGDLTERQKRTLKKDERSNQWFLWLLTIIFAVVAILPWIFSLAPMGSGSFVWTLGNILTATVGPLLWSLLWGLFAAVWAYSANDKYNYKLSRVQGRVSFVTVPGAGDNGGLFQMHVGKKKFEDVDTTLADVMQPGDEYAVYFLNNSPVGRKIMSAEFLGKNE